MFKPLLGVKITSLGVQTLYPPPCPPCSTAGGGQGGGGLGMVISSKKINKSAD